MSGVNWCEVTIGFDNFFTRPGAVVTLPSAKTGYPASRLIDGSDGLAWRPSGLNATEYLSVDLGVGNADIPQFVALLGHDFWKQGQTYGLNYSDNGIAWTSLVGWGTSAEDRSAIQAGEPSVYGLTTHRWWRVPMRVFISDAPQASEIYVGRRVSFLSQVELTGFDPFTERSDREDSRTEAGYLLRTRVQDNRRTMPLRWRFEVGTTLDRTHAAEGWRTWWDQCVLGGRPFVAHWAAAVAHVFNRDGFYGFVTGSPRVTWADARGGRRHVEVTIEGARPWR